MAFLVSKPVRFSSSVQLWGESDSTRGDGHKLKDRRIRLNIRKPFSTVGVIEHWHRFPREVVKSPSLEIPKKTTYTWPWATGSRWSCFNRDFGPGDLQKSIPASTIICDSANPLERSLPLKPPARCEVTGKLNDSSSPLLQFVTGGQLYVIQFDSLELVNGQILLFVTPI